MKTKLQNTKDRLLRYDSRICIQLTLLVKVEGPAPGTSQMKGKKECVPGRRDNMYQS